MRNLTLSAVVLVAAVMLGAPAFAATTQFNKGLADLNPVDGTLDTGDWLWTDAANWSVQVPLDGDTISFTRINWANPIGLNTNGANLNLPTAQISGTYNGSVITMYDANHMTPIYKATPVPNTLLSGKTAFDPNATLGYTSLVDAANASPTLTLSKIDYSKQHQVVFMMPVTVGTLNDNGANYDFYGSVTITASASFNGRSDTDDTINFWSAVNASGATMTLGVDTVVNAYDTATVGTITVNNAEAEYHAKAGASSGGASATINVNSGTLYFEVEQTTFPAQVNVSAYAVLVGDLTGATYGTNVNLAEDAVLALTANEPVDTTPGVFDAKYWKGVMNKANDVVTEAGDDGNSVYKGAAVGPWVSGDMQGTIQAPAGVAELGVAVAGGRTKFTNNSEMLMTDTGTTQTANIYVGPGSSMYMDGGAVNQNSSADPGLQVTTFNVYGQGGEATSLWLNINGVKADQTYNVYNGVAYTNTNGQGNYGKVVLYDGSGFSCGSGEAFKNIPTAGQYVFEDGTVIQMGSNLQTALDKYGATVTVGGDDTGFFHLKGETIACFDSSRDQTLVDGNMQKIIAVSNVSMSNNNAYRFKGYGLHLGDGKYLLLERNVDSTAAGTTFIGTDLGSSTVGIAAEPGSNNYIAAPFDANSATLVIGSDTPMTFVNVGTNTWNQRSTSMATGTVRLTGGLVKTYQIDIKSGRLNLDYAQDLGGTDVLIGANGTLQAGKAVTLNKVSGSGAIASGTNLTFATLAPGDGVGTIAADNLVFASGSTYEWQLADANTGSGVAGSDWDLIQATGNIDFAGNYTIKMVAESLTATITADQVFAIAGAGGSITGDFTAASAGFDYDDPSKWAGSVPELAYDTLTKTLTITGLKYSLVLPGDTNEDGVVDAADYITLKQNFGTATGGGASAGDFDETGTVDWADLSVLMANMGAGGPAPATIPEPATLGLLALGALAVVRRRRK